MKSLPSLVSGLNNFLLLCPGIAAVLLFLVAVFFLHPDDDMVAVCVVREGDAGFQKSLVYRMEQALFFQFIAGVESAWYGGYQLAALVCLAGKGGKILLFFIKLILYI